MPGSAIFETVCRRLRTPVHIINADGRVIWRNDASVAQLSLDDDLPFSREGIVQEVVATGTAQERQIRFEGKVLSIALTPLNGVVSEVITDVTAEMTDKLTGLLNRRAFDFFVEERIAFHSRNPETPNCLAILDIDHFKVVNDTHGHAAGDAVLRDVGSILKTFSRQADITARHGGEEFGMLLAHTNLQGAREWLERIRRTIECHTVSGFNGRIRVTMSGGIVELERGKTLAELCREADRALYAAKDAGRNRIVCPG